MNIQNQTHLPASHKQRSNIKRPTEKKHPLTSKRKSVSKMLAKPKLNTDDIPCKPWLKRDGSLKSDQEIAILGRKWSAETWNNYLEADIGIIEDEELSFFNDMDTETITERVEVLKFLQESKYYDDLEMALLIALAKLSKTERIIIRDSFWSMLSDQEIAQQISSTHSSVRNLKHRAIKKLGHALSSKSLKKEISKLNKNGTLIAVISKRKQWLTGDLLTFC